MVEVASVLPRADLAPVSLGGDHVGISSELKVLKVAQSAESEMKSDRQTVLIGTRTHTHPDSISSRLRL